MPLKAEPINSTDIQYRIEHFDERVSEGDARPADPAFAAEEKITEDRNIVIGLNRRVA
jgi:hypothetical protein